MFRRFARPRIFRLSLSSACSLPSRLLFALASVDVSQSAARDQADVAKETIAGGRGVLNGMEETTGEQRDRVNEFVQDCTDGYSSPCQRRRRAACSKAFARNASISSLLDGAFFGCGWPPCGKTE